MRVISVLAELINFLKGPKNEDKSIGFVPTMGALHEGHCKLIESSSKENSITVVSIFVNPIQFDNKEDYDNYPRDLQGDLDHLKRLDVDVVFTPSENELYPSKSLVSINFGEMSNVMEGKYRNGHFEGVGIVVSKLFHIVQPTRAYFGLKDLQQYLLIKRMCVDLNFPTDIIGVETERAASGLAKSSRNRRLSEKGLTIAANIYSGLKIISDGIGKGMPLVDLLNATRSFYDSIEGLEIEYLESVNANSLSPVNSKENISELAVCVAGYVEGVRLIDNVYLRLK